MPDNVNSELKPCPFCGSQPVYIQIEDILWCDNCQAQAPNSVWDDRPFADAARQDQFERDCKAVERMIDNETHPDDMMPGAYHYNQGLISVLEHLRRAREKQHDKN